MKKRALLAVLISLVAALAMVALVGCGGGDKQAAIDAYKEAASNYADDVQDMKLDATLTVKADMQDMELIGIDGSMKMQYKLPDGFSIKADDPTEIVNSLDKIDMLLEIGGSMSAMDESTEIAMDIYATGNKIYMHLAAPDSEETKMFFDITPEMKQSILDSLEEAVGNAEGTSDVDFAQLADEFPIEKYVKSGSIDGDKVTLTVDLFKIVDDLAAKSAESGTDMADSLESAQQIKNALSNGDIIIEATISEDKQFKSFKISYDADIDLGAATGDEAGAASEDTTMHISFLLDCPTYEVNTGNAVQFPSFDGYEDVTAEMNADLENATTVEEDKVA